MDYLVFLFELLIKIAPLITGVSAMSIAIIVHRHNRLKDKEAIIDRSWRAQQQINLACAQSLDVAEAAEVLISGKFSGKNVTDQVMLRALYISFMYINRIYVVYSGYKSGIIKKKELDIEVTGTIKLIVNSEDLIKYCLSRGYPEDFVQFFLERFLEQQAEAETPRQASEFLKKVRGE